MPQQGTANTYTRLTQPETHTPSMDVFLIYSSIRAPKPPCAHPASPTHQVCGWFKDSVAQVMSKAFLVAESATDLTETPIETSFGHGRASFVPQPLDSQTPASFRAGTRLESLSKGR